MKKIIVLLIIIGLGAYLYMNGYVKIPENLGQDNFPSTSSSTYASSLRDEVIKAGASDAYVSLSSNETLVRFESPILNDDLLGLTYDIAKKAYSAKPAKTVRVEAYFSGEPILGLTVEDGDFENAQFEDIRRPEYKIETDLSLFDVVVYNVSLDEDSARVTLEYLADKEGFWKDYLAMSFVILEDAPWVKEVSLNYLSDNGSVTLTMSGDDILKVQSGKMTPDELINAVKISQVHGTPTMFACPDNKEDAYRLYVKAYNNVTRLMAENRTEEASKAYVIYLKAKDCYASFTSSTASSATPTGMLGEVHQVTLDTEGAMAVKFSTGEVKSEWKGWEDVDIVAEPWCVDYPALLGHYIDIGEMSIDDVTVENIPSSGYPENEVSAEIKTGHVYVNRNADGTYTVFALVSHEKLDDCGHRIVVRYRNVEG